MKCIFVGLLCCIFLFPAHAQNKQLKLQENDSSLSESIQQLPIYGFVNLTSFVEYYGSVNLGIQRKINSTEYISLETGYIYIIKPFLYGISRQGANEPINDTWGVKLLFDYRYDFNASTEDSNESTFISISPYVYFVNYKSSLVAGYDCNDQFGRCSYYRLFQLNTKRIIPGFYLNFGKEYDFDFLKMSISIGLGLRHIANFNDVPKQPVVDKFYLKGGGAAKIPEGFYSNLKVSYILYFKYR